MRESTLFKIRILSIISFFMFIFFCYHSLPSNAQWNPYSYTSLFQEQWSVTDTLPSILPLGEDIIDIMPWVTGTTTTNVTPHFPSFPTFSGSSDTFWMIRDIKTSGSYDPFFTQDIGGSSCFLFTQGSGVPYCPGVSIKIKVYWRDPGNRLRSAIQWYGPPLPYGSVFTIYPVFPRGSPDSNL